MKLLSGMSLTKLNILLWGIIAMAVIAILLFIGKTVSETSIKAEVSDRIDPTPTIITSMSEIGEWEFLAISDEEMVDTVRKNFLKDSQMVRIYYGKLSLGINMRKAKGGWATMKGDTAVVSLPPIELLDDNFIDEARTRAFIETGSWTDADRNFLYHKAYRLMLARCLTKQNILTAEDNARMQITSMLKALGVEKSEITFGKNDTTE